MTQKYFYNPYLIPVSVSQGVLTLTDHVEWGSCSVLPIQRWHIFLWLHSAGERDQSCEFHQQFTYFKCTFRISASLLTGDLFLNAFVVGSSRGVWAMAAERLVGGRVPVWGQLSLCYTRLSWLVCVRGHGQCLPLSCLWEKQLPDLQGLKINFNKCIISSCKSN